MISGDLHGLSKSFRAGKGNSLLRGRTVLMAIGFERGGARGCIATTVAMLGGSGIWLLVGD